MGKLIDLTGQRFGRLTVLERAWTRKGQLFWRCRCECGAVCDVQGSSLRGGRTRSCGCLHDELACNRLLEADYYRPEQVANKCLHQVWVNMRQRCRNPRNPEFHLYGGRGIDVCAEWKDYFTFERWAVASGYGPGLSIDRIDNDSGYSPTNCRWTTPKVQSNNQRKTTMLTYGGKTMALSFWADKFHISRETLKSRIKRGWSVEQALITPIKSKDRGQSL